MATTKVLRLPQPSLVGDVVVTVGPELLLSHGAYLKGSDSLGKEKFGSMS